MRASMLPAGVRRHIVEAPQDELINYIHQRDRVNDEFMFSMAELLVRLQPLLALLEEKEIDGRTRPKNRKVSTGKQVTS